MQKFNIVDMSFIIISLSVNNLFLLGIYLPFGKFVFFLMLVLYVFWVLFSGYGYLIWQKKKEAISKYASPIKYFLTMCIPFSLMLYFYVIQTLKSIPSYDGESGIVLMLITKVAIVLFLVGIMLSYSISYYFVKKK